MASPRISEAVQKQILELVNDGQGDRAIGRKLGLDHSTVIKYRTKAGIPAQQATPPAQQESKKVGEFVLDEWLDWMEDGQKLKKKASWSGVTGPIRLGDGTEPQILLQLGDTHIASWGTDHKLLRNVLKEINETDGLWVALMGDLIQMSIKLRSVIEVSDNMIPPEQQAQFLEQMLERILPKIAFSSWCNHGVEREEKQSGISHIKYLLSRRSAYFNGIGHPDVQVGDQTYRFACSHKFRGNSIYDSTFGPKRYARLEANDREIILQADLHRPAFTRYFEGGSPRLAMTNGTYQLASGYAQRYFSLRTFPDMPCVVLHHDVHKFIPFMNLDEALKYVGR